MRFNYFYFSYALILAAAVAGGFGYGARPAQALTVTAVYLTASDAAISPVVLTVDQTLIDVWKGSKTINRKPRSFSEQPPLSVLLNDYFGISRGSNSITYLTTYGYQPGLIYDWLTEQSSSINKPAAEPEMTVLGDTVTVFNPGENGYRVILKDSTDKILNALDKQIDQVTISLEMTVPQRSLASTNSFGIKELLARGESNFAGSPANRRHNIAVGVKKVSGMIIKPGEEFSFNKYLGPVEEEEGFLPELVIKKTGTVPELGGGLCQVSSTVFRAAMQAGLPIAERRNHSYAVQYYAPQGTDATIYPGVTDFRFTNDTPGSILVWPQIIGKNTLVYDFYGTKDDRVVMLEKPFIYDKKPDGSMKATWERTVVNNGVSAQDSFESVYQSAALFHKQEMFVAGAVHVGIPATNGKPAVLPGTTDAPKAIN